MVSKLSNNASYYANYKPASVNSNESKVNSANNVEKVDKIESIKEKIANGTYVLDMSKTARSMVDELI
jgi:anti-sigma28 factor (negative regulator of flagellin synthesis)